jgi:HD-like signal output (HDOD) protein
MIRILTPRPPAQKASDTLTEQDRVALYRLAPIRTYRKSENVVPGKDRTDSFFEVVEGKIQVFGVTDLPFGSALQFGTGDIISPIAPATGVTFWIQALEPSVILEITPAVFANMPERFNTWLYKNALRSYDRSTRVLRSANRDLERKNRLLSQRWEYQSAQSHNVADHPMIQGFIRQLPRLPAFATDIAMKLLDDDVSLQSVADSIKQDPALAGIVLRHVNSAQYSFDKRIDSFYHACMIMGQNNIYRLLMSEGMRQSLRKTADAQAFQAHACLISCLCYEVSRLSEGVQAQTVTTIGLMHDVGKIAATLLVEQHPEIGPFASLLDTAKIGADLVRSWGLPTRIGDVIQFQDNVEFAPPESIEHGYGKEVAILHLAHTFEGMLTGNPVDGARSPFVNDCCAYLKISGSAADVYKTKILPNLVKTKNKLPLEIRGIIPDQTA